MKKKFLIKIPKNIHIIYSEKKKFLTIIGPTITKSLVLKLKLRIIISQNLIEVTNDFLIQPTNNNKKQINTLRGTIIALIKQILLEVRSIICKKLKFIGVGYRAFEIEKLENLLMFKLGYSHFLYFKIPLKLKISCRKFTKLFIFGNSYQDVTQTAALIRSCKKPEPYKGKGILYETEKIILKEGKKV